MPGTDGLEVCRRLKADPATAAIPVIFVTAQTDPVDETRALELGGVDFITKPVKPVNPALVRAREDPADLEGAKRAAARAGVPRRLDRRGQTVASNILP
jgi:CheY-like chemotaxis protein